ncbi:MAG: Gfo/Idh/MocA family oxidoreductase [Lentisphaeria bacterium]|nr:Gfo/Idh/MocA family oxidoreductase [Lentisphaeria bacterium]NQZ71285.1 Gfo/Idh/MocA family oxidoreductase [Lentisphaeria bacterium]
MRKKYCIVGVGGRSDMFISAIFGDHIDVAELCGACDRSRVRMKFILDKNCEKYEHPEIPQYGDADFDTMLDTHKPDVVIVTTMDCYHHEYICRAMRKGCDVITEKPMTTDEVKCQEIIDTQKETGQHVTVTFNYRYTPIATKVKELIMTGEIGDVTSVHFEWVLNTSHGADYFRRWHREKENSGGLMVHKSTHHFDLINWWLDSTPEIVFAQGSLAFYGKENAKSRGLTYDYAHYSDDLDASKKDSFAIDILADKNLKGMYKDAEEESGYHRDRNVFGGPIDIEDNVCVQVKYENNALMSYTLNAHSPWEGYNIMFNGTKGRLEFCLKENTYVSGAEDDINLAENREKDTIVESVVPVIVLQKHFQKPVEVDYEKAVGGHGGGDVRLLKDIFKGVQDDTYGHAAGFVDGAKSILTGIAANKSMRTGMPVNVKDLVKF